jgi:hypothetical protein
MSTLEDWGPWPDDTWPPGGEPASGYVVRTEQGPTELIRVSVEHGLRPFELARHADESRGLELLASRAPRYVQAILEPLLGAPLTLAEGDAFGWLPLADAAWDTRRIGGDGPRGAHGGRSSLLLLVAGNRRGTASQPVSLGDDATLQLTVRITEVEGEWRLDVLGSVATLPGRWLQGTSLEDVNQALTDPVRLDLAEAARLALGLAASPHIEAHHLERRFGGAPQVARIRGLGVDDGLVFAFDADVSPGPAGWALSLRSRAPLVSAAQADVFEDDPESAVPAGNARGRRPTKGSQQLDPLRQPTTRLPNNRVLGGNRWQVLESWVAHRQPQAAPHQLPPVAPPPAPPLRSDHLSAAQAWLRGADFFARIDAYGLATTLGQSRLQLPLTLMHRAPLRGAPDGDVVNAEVRGDRLGNGKVGLQVRFGEAAPRHGERHAGPQGAATRQGLGLAADARWAWHEFGHVLVGAATARLELPFSHGVGDALAALVTAATAKDPGLTFPWVRLNRRHDREATAGWCWCGRRSFFHRLKRPNEGQNAGYFEEQLLSSTLMRAWRGLGGGTTGSDEASLRVRERAADYLVALLMHATLQLPTGSQAAAYGVERLRDALLAADNMGGTWSCQASWPESRGVRTWARRHGRAQAVLRWAFEQQGLHETASAGRWLEEAARPRVDLYIEDSAQRHGHYGPVQARWPTDVPNPGWLAADDALRLAGNQVHVTVLNRGTQPAQHVRVLAWAAKADAATGDPVAWVQLAKSGAPPQTIGPDEGLQQYHFDAPGFSPAWLFAAATAPRDRCLIDPHTGNTPATMDPPTARDELIELVSQDNNCALRQV